MTQAERGALASEGDVTTYALGSVLSGGSSTPTPNTPEAWADMIDGYQRAALATRLQIPLIYGVDAVHGHNNLVGATVMPHNIGLGASRDPRLTQKTGAVTAREPRATGVSWNFSPCLCVTRDGTGKRWRSWRRRTGRPEGTRGKPGARVGSRTPRCPAPHQAHRPFSLPFR
jgi:beta-glucosidase